MRPVIGLSVGGRESWRDDGTSYRSYAAAVERAGGLPVPVGMRGAPDLAECAGLLVPGGQDIHPRYYGRTRGNEHLSDEDYITRYGIETEESRDKAEFPLITEALECGKPILSICRGIQSLNVLLARKLIPDIAQCVPGSLVHRSHGTGVSESHEVQIEPGSLMEAVYGAGTLKVNTRHHQGMTRDMVHESLRVTAVAPDGLVEAVEGVASGYVVGVQWHPERARDKYIYDVSGPLFESFVRACERQ